MFYNFGLNLFSVLTNLIELHILLDKQQTGIAKLKWQFWVYKTWYLNNIVHGVKAEESGSQGYVLREGDGH